MDVVYPQPHCGEIDDRPGFVKLHFMYYGKFSFQNKTLLMRSLKSRPKNLSAASLGTILKFKAVSFHPKNLI